MGGKRKRASVNPAAAVDSEPSHSDSDPIMDVEHDDEHEHEHEHDPQVDPGDGKHSHDHRDSRGRPGHPVVDTDERLRDDVTQFRETQTLFQSNLVRLQLDELLREVRVLPSDKMVTSIERLLRQVHDTIRHLPTTNVAVENPASLKKLNASFSKWNLEIPSDTQVKDFQVAAPQHVHVIGSFLLRTITRPVVNVDLAVEMPDSIFHRKDAINNKYLHKRLIYVASLANYLSENIANLESGAFDVSISYFRGDTRKPIVVISSRDKTGYSPKRVVIRLIPAMSSNALEFHRLEPGRNALRNAEMSPTPQYNSAILEDALFVSHLTDVHGEASKCPAIGEALTLVKVWLRQRDLHGDMASAFAVPGASLKSLVQKPVDGGEDNSSAADSHATQHQQHHVFTENLFNGFLCSMLLIYLVRIRRIHRSMSSFQMFTVFLDFIASTDLTSSAISFPARAEASADEKSESLGLPASSLFPSSFPADSPTAEILAHFSPFFPVVFVDPTHRLNLAHRVSAASYKLLRMHAQRSVSILHGQWLAHIPSLFSSLFLTKQPLALFFDWNMQVPLDADQCRFLRSELHDSPDSDLSQSGLTLSTRLSALGSLNRLLSVLQTGLGDRALGCHLSVLFASVSPARTPEPPTVPEPVAKKSKKAGAKKSVDASVISAPSASSTKPPVAGYLSIGLIVNPAVSPSIVVRGPASNDEPAVAAFRATWGPEISEIRRFRDGSIVIACVFDVPWYQRHRILPRMATHLLQHHLPKLLVAGPSAATTTVSVLGAELDPLICSWNGTASLAAADHPASATTNDALVAQLTDDPVSVAPDVALALGSLSNLLVVLPDMPLRVTSLFPADPVFRHTAVRYPRPVDALNAAELVARDNPLADCCVQPVRVLVEFESSSEWPLEDASVVERLVSAFYAQMVIALRKHHKAELRAFAGRDYVDIFFQKFVFRIRADPYRSLTQSASPADEFSGSDSGIPGVWKTPLNHYITMDHGVRVDPVRLVRHHQFIDQIRNTFISYPAAVRLAKRWVSSHLFANHLCGEAVELLMAYVFTAHPHRPTALPIGVDSVSPAPTASHTDVLENPLAPMTPQSAFLRFLDLLCTWDWEHSPLTVIPAFSQGGSSSNSPWSTEDVDRIMQRFDQLRSVGSNSASSASSSGPESSGNHQLPRSSAIFLVAPYENTADSTSISAWTRHRPTHESLGHIAHAAQQSLVNVLGTRYPWLSANESRLIVQPSELFRPDASGMIDVVFDLDNRCLSFSIVPVVDRFDTSLGDRSTTVSILRDAIQKNSQLVDGRRKRMETLLSSAMSLKSLSDKRDELPLHGRALIGDFSMERLLLDLERRFGRWVTFYSNIPDGSIGRVLGTSIADDVNDPSSSQVHLFAVGGAPRIGVQLKQSCASSFGFKLASHAQYSRWSVDESKSTTPAKRPTDIVPVSGTYDVRMIMSDIGRVLGTTMKSVHVVSE